MTNYKFSLPIGDWSDDGHGKCDRYVISSNKSVEEVREIHFAMKGKFGFDVTEFACAYGDSEVPSEVVTKLIELGFNGFNGDAWYDELVEGETYYATSSFMADVWVFLLMKVDSELRLEVAKDVPMLPFYGLVGYGCFN